MPKITWSSTCEGNNVISVNGKMEQNGKVMTCLSMKKQA